IKNYSSQFIIGGLKFLKVPRNAYQVGEHGDVTFFYNQSHKIEFHITAVEAPKKDKIAETLQEIVDGAQRNVDCFQSKECFKQFPETEQGVYQFLFEISHSIDCDREPRSHYRLCMAHIANYIALCAGFLYRASGNGSFLDGFSEPLTQCTDLIQDYGTFYNQYLSRACVKEKLTENACPRFERWRRILSFFSWIFEE
ncbi:MAG: hypothetical protein ABH896_04840, partial [Candidatus Jacksonbacteria bacterium]